MNVGTELRHAREARGLSLDTLAARTRIQARLLDSIEREDLATMPPRPYGRGFVAAYAREVGLEPTQTVRNYFAQFAANPAHLHPAPAAAPRDRGGLDEDRSRQWIAAAAILALLIAAGAARLWMAAPPDAPEAMVVGTSGTAPAAVPDARPAMHTAPAAAPGAAAPATDPLPLVVVLEADRPSWISATTDGSRRLYRIMRPGERETLRAAETIVIRVGDAGAMRWSVYGAAPQLMGRPGEVRTERVNGER